MNKSWDMMYEYAKAYYIENNNLLIPTNYTIDNVNLGKWIIEQRSLFKNHRMSEKHVTKLENMGMIWNIYKSYDLIYSNLKSYVETKGSIYSLNTRDSLYKWIMEQIQNYKLGELTLKQETELLNLGVPLNKQNTPKRNWNDRYNELIYTITSKKINLKSYKRNINWVKKELKIYFEGSMSKEKVAALRISGFLPNDDEFDIKIVSILEKLNNSILNESDDVKQLQIEYLKIINYRQNNQYQQKNIKNTCI